MVDLREMFSINGQFYEKVQKEQSAKNLLAANALAVLLVVLDNWDLGFALVVFWWQNVIIGIFNVIRILTYPDEFLKGATISKGNTPVLSGEKAAKTAKIFLAGFFAVHYGFFHFGYYSFLAQYFKTVNAGLVFLMIAVFFLQEGYAYLASRFNGEKPADLGRLFFFPYFRIFPMHIIIIVGMVILMVFSGIFGEKMGLMIGEKIVLVIFLALKIKADIQMHLYEKDPAWLPGFIKNKMKGSGIFNRDFEKGGANADA
jgi:hypothetical protein